MEQAGDRAAADAKLDAQIEARREKAARKLEDDRQARERLTMRLAVYEPIASDPRCSRRDRMQARVVVAAARAGLKSLAAATKLTEPDLSPEPTLAERQGAASRQSFAQAQEHFDKGSESWRQSRVSLKRANAQGGARYSTLTSLIGWGVLGLLVGGNYLLFRFLLETNYFDWYLHHGALINFVFGFISIAVVLDAYPDLISSNGLYYIYACGQLVAHVFRAWRDTTYEADRGAKTWWLPTVFDFVVSFAVFVVIGLIVVAWALVVAPVQHVAYLVAGAPARNAIRNDKDPRYDPETDRLRTDAPQGFSIGFRAKPVTLTAALATAAFLVAGVSGL